MCGIFSFLRTELRKIMNIYVGNLSYDMSEIELKELFEEFGVVEKAIIIKDRETGRSKGFGFIEMETQDGADAAIESLDGTDSNGRNLKVNQARPRTAGPRPNEKRW